MIESEYRDHPSLFNAKFWSFVQSTYGSPVVKERDYSDVTDDLVSIIIIS